MIIYHQNLQLKLENYLGDSNDEHKELHEQPSHGQLPRLLQDLFELLLQILSLSRIPTSLLVALESVVVGNSTTTTGCMTERQGSRHGWRGASGILSRESGLLGVYLNMEMQFFKI